MNEVGISDERDVEGASPPPSDTVALIRRYMQIQGAKIRKNRELVRPFLAPVLDRVGTPAAARVEAAIHSGSLPMEVFKGAFRKEVTPYISIREVVERSGPSDADDPF